MEVKITELEGLLLDWAVGFVKFSRSRSMTNAEIEEWARANKPSTDLTQACHVLEDLFIIPTWSELWGQWEVPHPKNAALRILGQTPIIAALRCFVALEVGDKIEIPDELLKSVQKQKENSANQDSATEALIRHMLRALERASKIMDPEAQAFQDSAIEAGRAWLKNLESKK